MSVSEVSDSGFDQDIDQLFASEEKEGYSKANWPDPHVEAFQVYVKSNTVSYHSRPGFEAKNMPSFRHYQGRNGGYINIYSSEKEGSVYGIGNGIFVIGRVRVKGHYDNGVFIPKGFKPGEDITHDPKLIKICGKYFPEWKGKDIWIDGNTGGWFNTQEQKETYINTGWLPVNFHLYVRGNQLADFHYRGFEAKDLPIINHYPGSDGGYISICTRKKEGSVFGIGNGLYVACQIRVKGHFEGDSYEHFVPEGFKVFEDYSTDPELVKICREYLPELEEKDICLNGDKSKYFRIQETILKQSKFPAQSMGYY